MCFKRFVFKAKKKERRDRPFFYFWRAREDKTACEKKLAQNLLFFLFSHTHSFIFARRYLVLAVLKLT